MQRISDSHLKDYFLGWQCRIRQIAMREHGGRPTAGLAPRVLTRSGQVLTPSLVLLLMPKRPEASTAFFRFQVQKTHDPMQRREAALKYLGADYYQAPESFADTMTAVFPAPANVTTEIVSAKKVLLEFSQYAQTFRLFAKTRRLRPRSAWHDASLWHNRLFNPDVPNDAEVLAFAPEWKNAVAEPWPQTIAPVKGESV
jgi:hypothetical protein